MIIAKLCACEIDDCGAPCARDHILLNIFNFVSNTLRFLSDEVDTRSLVYIERFATKMVSGFDVINSLV